MPEEILWNTLEVWQMGALLRNLELPEVRNGWQPLIQDLDTHDRELWDEGERIVNFQLGRFAKFAAAYFLTFVAVICERSRTDGPLTLDSVGTVYHLDQVVKFQDNEQDYKYYLQHIIPHRALERTQDPALSACWERIQNYLDSDAWEAIGPRTELAALLDQIRRANRAAWLNYNPHAGTRSEENLMTQSIVNLIQLLDQWTESLSPMWAALPAEERLPLSTATPAQLPAPPSGVAGTICNLIALGVKQIILTGAPGTGKTCAAKEAARYLGARLDGTEEGEPYVLVPFHPSYDYTDFVEGLRPVERNGTPTFVRLDGTFKAFCRKVAEQGNPDCRYFFLIDEINRADLSKVFGELMFCLETDKRGEPVPTQYRNLPTYDAANQQPLVNDIFEAGFYVPENVYIIGTMNDIDRSVESMDFALRRRFTWHEVEVTHDLLRDAFQTGNFCRTLNLRADDAAKQVMALNDVIASLPEEAERGESTGLGGQYGLNRQYYIAQGQFTGLPDPLPEDEDARDELDALLRFVWKYRLQSLLREYVRGEEEEKVTAFLTQCEKALCLQAEPEEDEEA